MFDECKGPFFERYEEGHAFVDGHAQTVANALQWLDQLSILARHPGNDWYWRTWSVRKGASATAQLTLESSSNSLPEWL